MYKYTLAPAVIRCDSDKVSKFDDILTQPDVIVAYNGGYADYEDPADYIRCGALKGRVIA
jgi:hypothetical protein